jgi:hypothetical protein
MPLSFYHAYTWKFKCFNVVKGKYTSSHLCTWHFTSSMWPFFSIHLGFSVDFLKHSLFNTSFSYIAILLAHPLARYQCYWLSIFIRCVCVCRAEKHYSTYLTETKKTPLLSRSLGPLRFISFPISNVNVWIAIHNC